MQSFNRKTFPSSKKLPTIIALVIREKMAERRAKRNDVCCSVTIDR